MHTLQALDALYEATRALGVSRDRALVAVATLMRDWARDTDFHEAKREGRNRVVVAAG